MREVYKFIGIGMVLLLVSCQSEPSLQNYYVEHQNDTNFMVIDLPASMIMGNLKDLPKDAQEALSHIDKANMLLFPLNGSNHKQYKIQRDKVLAILDSDDYKLLFRLKYSEAHIQLRYLGNQKEIDEFVLLAYDDSKGFAVARILGDNMNPQAIIKTLQAVRKGNVKVNVDNLKGLVN